MSKAQIDAIRELHAEDLFRGHLSNGCKTCGPTGDVGYPCPTIAALDERKSDLADYGGSGPGGSMELAWINTRMGELWPAWKKAQSDLWGNP